MPIILYGKAFWTDLIKFDALVEHGLISPEDVLLYSVQDDVDSAFECLRRGLEAPPIEA